LADRYGVAAEEMHWFVGDIDRIERDTLPIPPLLRPVDIQAAPRGVVLNDMLISGEIDASIHYAPPREFSQDKPRIKRLFADCGRSEREYFQSTGIFPIMHLIGIRRSLVEDHVPLARQVYDAFAEAKNATTADISSDVPPPDSPPWSYGILKNRSALGSLTRYAFEQGLTDRQLSLDDLFVSSLMDE
jgi:4,5-dihydroxyphthalate decarboxylase